MLLKYDDLDEWEGTRIKLHQQIQVAPWSLLPAHIGAEYTERAYPILLTQLG